MKQKLGIAAVVLALGALGVLGTASLGRTQAGAKISLGIYTPSIAFANSQDRFRYVQRLAKAIEQGTGTKVEAKAFTSLSALKRQRADFAIIDAQCVAVNPRWNVLARAKVGGKTSQQWALYSSQGGNMNALRGKRLSFVRMGCQDENFVFNAMLDSEIGKGFFGGRNGKPDVPAAVAEVASYKGAEAVFAPVGNQKGLTRVFTASAVPTPAFVQLNSSVSKSLSDKIQAAVVGYGGGGAISGWAKADDSAYRALRAKMRTQVKRPVFAAPPPVRIDARDILVDPKTLNQTESTDIGQHFERPADTL